MHNKSAQQFIEVSQDKLLRHITSICFPAFHLNSEGYTNMMPGHSAGDKIHANLEASLTRVDCHDQLGIRASLKKWVQRVQLNPRSVDKFDAVGSAITICCSGLKWVRVVRRTC